MSGQGSLGEMCVFEMKAQFSGWLLASVDFLLICMLQAHWHMWRDPHVLHFWRSVWTYSWAFCVWAAFCLSFSSVRMFCSSTHFCSLSSSTLAMFLISFSTWTTPALFSVMSSLIPLAVKFLLDAAADLLANLSNFERSLSQSKLFVGRLSKSSGLIYKGKWQIEICGSSRTSHSTSFFRCGDSTSTKPRNYLHVSHNYIIFLDGSLGHLLPINGIL